MQHLWESKLVVILEGLTRGRIALCSEMQLARKSLQMHFDVHVCLLEKSLLCLLGAIFGPHFGGQILAPFLSPFFNPHFGVRKWCKNLQKFLLSKLHNKLFSSKQTCTSKCICGDFLASCISEHNAILPLVKHSKITTSFDSHKCCTQARWIRASESHTVEVLSCETDFLHEK